MSMIFLTSILFSWFLFFVINAHFFLGSNRIVALKNSVYPIIRSSFPLVFGTLFAVVAGRYLFLILTANIPLFTVPIIFYSYVFFNAFLFWLPIVGSGLYRDYKSIIAHMMPFGAPMFLCTVLPIVEIFSQLIRPFTLVIRFATNISAGHIMIFMFSYFSILSSVLAPFLYIVLTVLLILEICIAILQCYIFLTLLGLYFRETL